jgi:hypothetical protein
MMDKKWLIYAALLLVGAMGSSKILVGPLAKLPRF